MGVSAPAVPLRILRTDRVSVNSTITVKPNIHAGSMRVEVLRRAPIDRRGSTVRRCRSGNHLVLVFAGVVRSKIIVRSGKFSLGEVDGTGRMPGAGRISFVIVCSGDGASAACGTQAEGWSEKNLENDFFAAV